jgi:hypothetical protein
LDGSLHCALPQFTEYQTAEEILLLGSCPSQQRIDRLGPSRGRSRPAETGHMGKDSIDLADGQ